MTQVTRPNLDWISLEESCELLGVSRPTFDKRRKELRLKETQWRGRLWFSRRQLAERLLPCEPVNLSSSVELVESSRSRVSQIKRKNHIYDLRSLRSIDSFGVVCLLCTLISEKEKISIIHGDSSVCRLLGSVGFFSELVKLRADILGLSRTPTLGSWIDPAILQPLTSVTYKGSERQAVVELQKSLGIQGFTSEMGNYVGWLIGELADNALTHGKATCYTITQRIDTSMRRLVIGLGDRGLGIPNTLKANPKYSSLSDRQALLTAFLPYVSGWGDEYKRGKGLTDVVKILAGNRGHMRVESGGLALQMDFRSEAKIEFVSPMTRSCGTRYSLVLEDQGFREVSRSEAASYITEAMGRIFEQNEQKEQKKTKNSARSKKPKERA